MHSLMDKLLGVVVGSENLFQMLYLLFLGRMVDGRVLHLLVRADTTDLLTDTGW